MITDPYDWLLIRATKDMSPTLQRLRRIWIARCMIPAEYAHTCDKYIAERLIEILRICGKENRLMDAIEMADPTQGWKLGIKDGATYWERIVLALACIVRHMMVAEFPNYRSPAMFRERVA